ncbi:uncharacterized protein LOC108113141 [Drosophila eugracilis]|uniref:uncharacterized protein LOC108113141 n=1 Tax=Drosophila eugracilis TaxID=29029 RepID=UPI0007E80754|nr:uncharacterized protein LOC108113141 [Drosophila eugracilis]
MTVDEPQIVAISITHKQQVGYLKEQPTWIHCPSCEKSGTSVVQLEVVTCLQRFLVFTKLCKKWPGRQDINHYCSHCGCFIGRFVDISCMERCLSRSARKQAAVDDMTLKTRPKDCAERAQKSREKVLANREKKRAEKAAKELDKSRTQIAVHQ